MNGKAFSFIYDPDQGYIGLVKDSLYYRKQLGTGRDNLVSIVNDDPVAGDQKTAAVKLELKQLTEGMYEISRYLILNNKK